MVQVSEKLSVIIPTKDHPDDLRRLLASLAAQTSRPEEVIVVDGGDVPVERLVAESWPFVARYERVFPPGLAKQQNAGVRRLDPVATLVAFIDDDIVLDPDAIDRMRAFWSEAPADVGGAAFNLVNNTAAPRHVWLKALFGLDSWKRGVLLRSGYQTKIGNVERTVEVEWLYGGATAWRRSLLASAPFDEWFEGPGHLYELEFCFRVGLRHRLMVVADARARELSTVRSWNDARLGRWQVVNRLYFVRKYNGQRGLSVTRCWVALMAQFGLNVIRAVVEGNRRYFERAQGNLVGFRDALRS